jgi:hypothetical protein
MSEIKTRGDMLDYITKCAKDYRLECKDSITRNSHMNELNEFEKKAFMVFDVNQKYIDAILVDFINYIGANQCLDWGLYTRNLIEKDERR